jgi:hypothetical protein
MATMIGATRLRKISCALLLCGIVLVAMHSHATIDPLESQPISDGHHCQLCIAAHLPQVVSAAAAVLAPPGPSAVAPVIVELDAMGEPQLAFSLYMRPPPSL